MKYELKNVGVVLTLPVGCDVSDDGSVFGPDGLDFAVFAEPRSEQALAMRREIAEGRSYIDAVTHEEITPEGWLLLFTTEDGELGFELGRRAGGTQFVFWSDHLRDESARQAAVGAGRDAGLPDARP